MASRAKRGVYAMETCPACHGELRKGVFAGGRQWKTCPECSAARGEHVFRRYPEDFGTTDRRASGTNPDGPQSYCQACRGRGQVSGNMMRCSKIQAFLKGRR